MFGLLTHAATSAAAFLYPTLATYKALRSGDVAQQTFCLMYWAILACVLFVEHWAYYAIAWLPFYGELKLAAILWLVLPQTQGATYLYLEYLSPYITRHEREIDAGLQHIVLNAKRFGGDALRATVVWCGDILFGASEKEFRQRAATAARGDDGLASGGDSGVQAGAGWNFGSLFAKVSSLPVSDHVSASLRNLLAMANKQAPVPEQALEALIPPHLEGAQRQRYVQQQKARLQQMLAMLDSTTAADSSAATSAVGAAAAAGAARPARSAVAEGLFPRRPQSAGSGASAASAGSAPGNKRSVSTPVGYLPPPAYDEEGFEVIQETEGSRSSSPGKRLSTADGARVRRQHSPARQASPAAVGRGEAAPGSPSAQAAAHAAAGAKRTANAGGGWFWRTLSSTSSVDGT